MMTRIAILVFLVAAGAASAHTGTGPSAAEQAAYTAEQLANAILNQPDPLLEAKPEKDGKETDDPRSVGCVSCHTGVTDMHGAKKVGCTECHGGDSSVVRNPGSVKGSITYDDAKRAAHVSPRYPEWWPTSANPERTYTKILKESKEWVRFMNPGDLRVARESCGTSKCHGDTVYNVKHSMMAHGSSLWAAVLYNNGAIGEKRAIYGEAYDEDGKPQTLMTIPPPVEEETFYKGILPYLEPLPRWEIGQPGNILRVFERGSKRKLETALFDKDEDPGKPDKGLSPRGLGTLNRTDPVFLGMQKTRLLDPILTMMGTNDQPGDYRNSGCTACHVMYANDRDPYHSAYLAKYGNRGHSDTVDPTIPKDEPGHPVRHRFTTAIPSSQCITCHIHPGTNMVMTYLGSIWWDNETDGEVMYPKEPKKLSAKESEEHLDRNPESASLKGKWSEPEFLANLTDLNSKTKDMQFNDYHGHGWVFRKVYKRDRKGNLLDADGKPISAADPDKFKKALHLKDIHLEKGMHCVDCHFSQDNHGDGKLYGEVRNTIEIGCTDCHGSITQKAQLFTTGPAAPKGGGTNLQGYRTPWGKRRFEWVDGQLIQRSGVIQDLEWVVKQTADTINPDSPDYNIKSRLAKTIRRDGKHWGDPSRPDAELAHSNTKLTCFACHSSWMTSCFGCHLPMKANKMKPALHNEGHVSRNWTSYNFQVIRDDVFMLGVDGTVTGNRVAPVRSSSAVLVSSQNQNREWIYSQQQTISSEGYSGQAMNTHVPHTVRGKETRQCTECHVSEKGDNNAWLAQTYLLGTNFVNFIGRYLYVGMEHHGFEATIVTERDEPQAVIGSHLHKLAYPEEYEKHHEEGLELEDGGEHKTEGEVLNLQLRGEYLYTANGPKGFEVFDVAQIDHKGFSEKIQNAPVSSWGQRTFVRTPFATDLAVPSTLGVDPTRKKRPENVEQAQHLLYAFVYITDKVEGLVLVQVATLLDGNPMNNFFKKDLVFNPNGILTGATHITLNGVHAYISTPKELVVVDLDDPLHPKITARIGKEFLCEPRRVAVQFRYAFVTDSCGLKVLDITDPAHPVPVKGASIELGHECRDIYVARTYAYIAAGYKGLIIVDVEKPEAPKVFWQYNAEGRIRDAHAVKVAMTNACAFAYVADGEYGVHVLQLTDPSRTQGHLGFSPEPNPKYIAHRKTPGKAVALSKGLDRDRGVDEAGNQLVVFGRIGARPFNRQELRKMYMRDGKVFTVTDDPPGEPDAHRVEPTATKLQDVETPSSGNMILRLKFD